MVSPVRSCLAFTIGLWLSVSAATGRVSARIEPQAVLLERVNVVRQDAHLIPLRYSPELERVALAHAQDMSDRGYIDHISPEGKSPLDRVRSAGVSGFHLLAENIGQSTVRPEPLRAILDAWLRSPAHAENLLNPAFNSTGIAIVRTRTGVTLVVQLFATF